MTRSFNNDFQNALQSLNDNYELRKVLCEIGVKIQPTTQYIRLVLFNHRRLYKWCHVYAGMRQSLERRRRKRLNIIRMMIFPSNLSQSAVWGIVMSYCD